MKAANLALPVPFSGAEVRDLVERARGAINAYYATMERDELSLFASTKEAEGAAAVAVETLMIAACFAGTSLDTSFIPSLAVWPQWDPFHGEHRDERDDFFSGLGKVLAAASDDVLAEAAEHETPEVREALAKALSPEQSEFHARLFSQLVRDSQYRVSLAARERLSLPWYAGVFDKDPRELLETSERAAFETEFEKLSRALTDKWYRVKERHALVEEVLPKLPDAVALPLLAHQLQEVTMNPSEGLVQEFIRRPASGPALARALCFRVDHHPLAYRLEDEASAWLQAARADKETVEILLAHLVRDGAFRIRQRRRMRLPTIIAGLWQKSWNPLPLFEAWLQLTEGATPYSKASALLDAARDTDAVATLREPVLDRVRTHGIEEQSIEKLLERILEVSAPQLSEDVTEEGERSRLESFRRWAVRRRIKELTHVGDAKRCRAQMQVWLSDETTRRLIEAEQQLLQCALPELRPALAKGELSFGQADRMIATIGSLYGGLASHSRSRSPTEPEEERLAKNRASVGPWLSADGKAVDEQEWAAYRRAREAAAMAGKKWRLGHRPEGDWHPLDLAFVSRAFACLSPNMEDFDVNAMWVFDMLTSKVEPEFLPWFEQLRRWQVEEDINPYLLTGLSKVIEELGGGGEVQPRPTLEKHEEWMDTEEDDES